MAVTIASALMVSCAYVPTPTAPSPAPIVEPTPTPAPAAVPVTPLPLAGITVDITVTPYAPTEGEPVVFTVIAAGGLAPLSYNWTFGDGAVASGETTRTHTYRVKGVKMLRVAVSDSDGRTVTGSREFVVQAEPAAPSRSAPVVLPPAPSPPPVPPPALIVTVTCTPNAHALPTPCNVNATYGGAQLPATSIVDVDWDWGDSLITTNGGVSATHVYANAGTYYVFATVTANTSDGAKVARVSKSIGVL